LLINKLNLFQTMHSNQNNFQKPFNPNMGGMGSMGGGMGGFRPNQKKIPNPANFKIVKCKNYERGKFKNKNSPLINLSIH